MRFVPNKKYQDNLPIPVSGPKAIKDKPEFCMPCIKNTTGLETDELRISKRPYGILFISKIYPSLVTTWWDSEKYPSWDILCS